MDLVDPGLPFPDHLGLLSPPPVGPTDQLCCGDVEARAIGAGVGNNVGLVSCRRRRVGALERVTHLPPAAVKDEEGARGSGSAGAGAEEEKRLVGPADAEAVEAGEGGVGAEVGAALPDAVGVGGGGAGEEGEEGALEVEGELEVEVRDAAECREERREAAAELGPGGAAVVAEEQQREAAAPEAERLLERGPSGGVLEGRVCAGGRKRGDGGSAVEADSEVERGVAAGNVTAVEYGGDLRSETLLARRVGLGGHLGRVGEPGERRDEAAHGSRVAQCHSVVRRAVRVLLDPHPLFLHSSLSRSLFVPSRNEVRRSSGEARKATKRYNLTHPFFFFFFFSPFFL